MEHISRDEAFTLLKKYNQDPFHIQHALTVEAVMIWYAKELGYGEGAFCSGRTDRSDLGSSIDASFQEYERHGIKVLKKEI